MQFPIIYADPAWTYRDRLTGHSLSIPYDTEPQGALCDLPVADLATRDAVLFMWAVSPQIPEALALMRAWGFRFVTVAFVWNKRTSRGKHVANMGRWTMGNVEICLLGKRGRPMRIRRNVRQLVEAERTTHSRKPDEVRHRIVDLMGDLPRVELFARERHAGWVTLGNDLDGRDLRDSIPALAAEADRPWHLPTPPMRHHRSAGSEAAL